MSSNSKDTKLVYSTSQGDLRKLRTDDQQAGTAKGTAATTPVVVRLDTKARRGKAVTLVSGIAHNPQVIEKLAKDLKALCGAGGTVENREILIQGDHRDKVCAKLTSLGYKIKRQ